MSKEEFEPLLNMAGFTTGTSPTDITMNTLTALGYVTSPITTLGINTLINAFTGQNAAKEQFRREELEDVDRRVNEWLESRAAYNNVMMNNGYTVGENALFEKLYGKDWEVKLRYPKVPRYQELDWDAYSKDLTDRAVGTTLAQKGIAAVQQAAAKQKELLSLQKRTSILSARTADINQARADAARGRDLKLEGLKGALQQRSGITAQQQQQKEEAVAAQQQQQALQQQQTQTAIQQRAQSQIVQQQQRDNAIQQAAALAEQRAAPKSLKDILIAPPRESDTAVPSGAPSGTQPLTRMRRPQVKI
jgi:hypothetical protein